MRLAERRRPDDRPADADSPRAILEQKQRVLSRRRFVIGLLFKMAATGAVVYLLFGVVLGVGLVLGDSMRPALYAGDVVIFRRTAAAARGDIVMIRPPDGGADYIKRVAGQPGDTVSLDRQSGELRINGRVCGGADADVLGRTLPAGDVRYPIRLGPDEYFVLGDNREHSRDSRHYGAIRRREIDGRVVAVIRVK